MALDYRLRGWLCVAGGFLVHLTLGTIYSFGNMTPYVTSYIRAYSSNSSLRYNETVWVFALAIGFQGFSMFLGGLINTKIGPRWTTLIGAWIMSAGVLLTSLTVKSSFSACLATYGVMFGLGVGMAYAPPLASAMKWLPNNKGLVNGIVVAGFGGGAFIFDQVQTAYINPNNQSPNLPLNNDTSSSEKYFSPYDQASVLERVPNCFLLLGGCYAVMQFIGCMLISDPPQDAETMPLIVEEDSVAVECTTSVRASSVTNEVDLHPRDVLKTRAFYTLWATFLVNGQAVVFISSLYKTYGQTFIYDDKFLALLGSFASVFNAGGRIMWGTLVDRFSYKVVMLCVCSSMMVFMMTLLATPYGGKAMFFIWICALFLIFSGNFALFPTITAKAFGSRYVAINFGLIFTSQAVTGPLCAVLTSTISDTLGWAGMFFLIAGFAFIGVLLTASFNLRRPDGRDL